MDTVTLPAEVQAEIDDKLTRLKALQPKSAKERFFMALEDVYRTSPPCDLHEPVGTMQ